MFSHHEVTEKQTSREKKPEDKRRNEKRESSSFLDEESDITGAYVFCDEVITEKGVEIIIF